jgi:hypothetical protein
MNLQKTAARLRQALSIAFVASIALGQLAAAEASAMRIDVRKNAPAMPAGFQVDVDVRKSPDRHGLHVFTIHVPKQKATEHYWRTDFWTVEQKTGATSVIPIHYEMNAQGTRTFEVSATSRVLADGGIVVVRVGPAAPLAETLYFVHLDSWL